MNEMDQKSQKRIAFINFYLAEKEFFLPDRLRSALDFIYMLTHKKHMDKALAIHKANEWYLKKYDIEYGKEYLWKKYNTRMSYIKNATDKYYKWCVEMRERNCGIKNPLCACGCGQEVTKKGNKFLNGHNAKCRSKEEDKQLAENMRQAKTVKDNCKVISLNSRKP